MAEKIDDLLFDPLAEPDKVKQVDTVHGKLPYYSAGDEKFGYVVRDSPKYTVFDDGPAVNAEGPVADGAVLKQNSTRICSSIFCIFNCSFRSCGTDEICHGRTFIR